MSKRFIPLEIHRGKAIKVTQVWEQENGLYRQYFFETDFVDPAYHIHALIQGIAGRNLSFNPGSTALEDGSTTHLKDGVSSFLHVARKSHVRTSQ